MAHRLDQSMRAIPWGGWRSKVFPVVSSFHQIYKANETRPCYLSTGRTTFHTRNLEAFTLARGNQVDIYCLPPHSSHKMQTLDKTFMGPSKHSTAKELKICLCSHPGQVVTVYQTGELFG